MKGKTPSSAEAISYNDDLLLQIHILLPAKSLITFKSVSSRWLSLITDASFRRLHTRRHRSPETSFLLRLSPSQFFHFNPTRKNLVPFHFNLDHLIFRQSCNGLLLVECRKDYYVYNPTTGESRNLLLPELHYKFPFLILAFDPRKSPHYKVFCMLFGGSSCVYNSETHSWNFVEEVYYVNRPLRYWVYSGNFMYSLSHKGGLSYFDIENGSFGAPTFGDSLNALCITESFGHVYRIARDTVTNNLVVDEITPNNGVLSFKPLLDFNISDWCPETETTPWRISFLGILKGESLVFHIPGKIMAYHFYERMFENLHDCSNVPGFYEGDKLKFAFGDYCPFVESLAPV